MTPFQAENVFLLRAPLVPDGPGLPLPGAGPGSPGACAELLASVAANAVLGEALDLASPSLSAVIRRVSTRGTAGLKAGQLRRAALAVLRYDIRMRTRPTPFGLFAGVTTGRFDSATKAERGTGHRTRTHVDMQWLTRIGHRLERDPAVLSALTVQAHQALVTRGGRRVLSSSSTGGVRLTEGARTRSTVSVRATPVVEHALTRAATPVPYEELVGHTAAAFPDAPVERVRGLLAELVRQEVLITGLRPPLDGGDPLRHLLDLLTGVTGATEETRRTHEALRRVEHERLAYDDRPVGEGREQLLRLLDTARTLEPDDTPLHIDTRLDVSLCLPHAVREVVEKATEVMWRLSRPKLGLFALRDYHHRFLDVYGADRLVPILELLDESSGLGAPAGYGWPNSEVPPTPPEEFRTARRDRAMARLVAAAQRDGLHEVVLEDGDLDELQHDTPRPADLPNSCEVTVQVVAPSAQAVDDGDFQVFLSPSPGSHRAGSTFARFADQHEEWRVDFAGLHRGCPVHIEGAVAVDLAFRTRSGRAANLAHTAPATGRRISVGVPEVPGVEELRLSDISVGATLERLTAVHTPTGREVVPVLGNMVSAPAQAPNAVRLLWEIGLEGQRLWEPWNWGPLVDMPFVPRVRYGRFVLAPAVWRLDTLRDRAGTPRTGEAGTEERERAVAAWRTRWNVPSRVLVVTTDQRLLLDLDEDWHRELLLDQALRHPDLIAQEIPGESEGWTRGPFGGHAAELVVPLVRNRRIAPARRPHAGRRQHPRTVHGLGSEWLYLKLHGSVRSQDELVRDHLPRLVDLVSGEADRWFFIRYTDEAGHHLRLRVHGTSPAALWGSVAPAVGAVLQEWQHTGLLRGHSLAQYDPETERYGGPGAERLAELVFQHDSEAAIELLRVAKDPSNGFGVDDLAVVSCAALAHAFGPPSPEVPGSVRDHGDDAAAAWLSMTGARRDLPTAFRARAAHWRGLVDPHGGWPSLSRDPAGARVLAALRRRDRAVEHLASAVREFDSTPEGRVVGSLLHMSCNRLFGGEGARELTVLGIARGAVQDNFNRRRHQS
ncbi:lantibiotic dehydratase [Streptomyces sp. NPDC002454]